MSNIVLECKNIWKKIDHHVIIKDVSITVKEGDILGFIGPNGAGKTTTMKMLLGLQTYNGGTVSIGDYDLKKHFVKAISNVGAIIENPDLYMYLSGYDNLKIASSCYQVSEERIQEVIKLVGLEDKIHEKVKKYSLGMRQRLGIAQAILHNPKLLILDEPMNGLDPEGIKDLKILLNQLSEQGMAIVISSHILSELENICNRVCILVNGKLIEDLKIEEAKKITSEINYILEVSNINLDKILYHYEIIDSYHIKVNTTKENITNIIKTLLLNDIEIYELIKETKSLEEIFLEKTTRDQKCLH